MNEIGSSSLGDAFNVPLERRLLRSNDPDMVVGEVLLGREYAAVAVHFDHILRNERDIRRILGLPSPATSHI